MSDNVLEFKPAATDSGGAPNFAHGYGTPGSCDHRSSTIQVDTFNNRLTCSKCKEPVEAIAVVKLWLDREWAQARRENAATWHRLDAEAQAEKQASKTRKAAYATLYRFGVTPEAYAEEYRKSMQRTELELKQDYSKTLAFGGQQ